ncbi:glutaredoxin [Moritella marina ATCC 15381]|uniref:Glutaredoxin n=1 Tax=Moritella marina ATCC 15381 TaxID=1202962 RepID=A0A5J6WHG9_MORMI|nr:glutaredoxin domain-containing protein [Moritella marina]QFI36650.1 glutaredoxin [Moritella marina ATCC 15381]
MDKQAVNITIYRWAGDWGPFHINIPCGECALTKDIVLDTLQNELDGIAVELEIKDWLNEWWQPLLKGGWHAPIIMVAGKVISQGRALNRGMLTQAVIEAHSQQVPITDQHIFGKQNCPHCQRAKRYLQQANIDYTYHDVITSPRALYEMLSRVKPLIDPKQPVTVPQIWIDGHYVGGADELSRIVKHEVKANTERGQCSLSEK